MYKLYILFSTGFKCVGLFDDWSKLMAGCVELHQAGYSLKIEEIL